MGGAYYEQSETKTECSYMQLQSADIPLPFDLDKLRHAILMEETASGRLTQAPFAHRTPEKIRRGIAMATTATFLMEHIWNVPAYRAHLQHLMEKWPIETR